MGKLQLAASEAHERILKERGEITFISAFVSGYDYAKEDLGWHSVEESLPEIDEEVIVMWFEYGEVRAEPLRQIAIASLIQPIQCVPMGEKRWTIPGVKYWMPMPKIPEDAR